MVTQDLLYESSEAALKTSNIAISDETAATGSDFSSTQAGLDWSYLQSGRLFGREEEIQILQEALKRRVSMSGGSQEFVLVSGRSGDGKSILVKNALEQFTRDGFQGYYLSGKFDQLQCNSKDSLRPMAAALLQLALALDQEEERVKEIQSKIKASQLDLTVLYRFVPHLGRIFLGSDSTFFGDGEQPPRDSNLLENQDIPLETTLLRFFQLISSTSHPIVLVMDDLQWADPKSLDLLELLSSDAEVQRLLVVGICRSNEVPWHHEFAAMLRRLEDKRKTHILHVQLKGLSVNDTQDLLAATMHQTTEKCKLFAERIHAKSDSGNPFFVVQLVKALHQSNVLLAGGGQCLWDDDEWETFVHEHQGIEDVVQLVSHQIQALPERCQQLLKLSACMGAELNTCLIATVLKQSISQVATILEFLQDEDMVVMQQGDQTYAFSHDRVQQAAYAIIPESETPAQHLSIGRTLLQKLPSHQVEENLLLIANQLLAGQGLLSTEEDRRDLAEICLRAGEKAMKASDYQLARHYLEMGWDLLPPRNWRDEYHLSLTMSCTRAEIDCCSGSFDQVYETIEEALTNCRCLKDKIRPWLIKIYALGVQARFNESTDLGLEVMACFGETFPSKPYIIYLVPDLVKVKLRLLRLVKRKSDMDILVDLPRMNTEDRGKMAILSILNLLAAYAFCANPDLFPFIVIRWTKLTLKYGLCEMSCLSFGMYGLLLVAMGERSEGVKFGRFAMKLWENCHPSSQMQYWPRLAIMVHGLSYPWKVPLRRTIEPLERAAALSLQTNDVESAQVAAYTLFLNQLAAGERIAVMEQRMNQYFPVIEMCGTGPWLALARVERHLIDGFLGKIKSPWELEAGSNDVEKHDFYLYQSVIYQRKQELAYHYGIIDVAVANCAHKRNNNGPPKAAYTVVHDMLFDCLTIIEDAARKGKGRRVFFPLRAWYYVRVFKELARTCPENALHKFCLIKGEAAALKGNLASAVKWYEKATEHACSQGMRQFQALGFERWAIAHQRLSGNEEEDLVQVKCLRQQAIEAYDLWGAAGLVAHLKCKYSL